CARPAARRAWMAAVDTWDPEQYERFAAERSAPFWDLLSLVRPVPGGRVVDLGCGNGELTAALHRRLEAAETLGLDSSPAMLEPAAGLGGGGLRFALGDIAGFDQGGWDVAFSNAALHWLPDHAGLFARLVAALNQGGQLAVQVAGHPDHPPPPRPRPRSRGRGAVPGRPGRLPPGLAGPGPGVVRRAARPPRPGRPAH